MRNLSTARRVAALAVLGLPAQATGAQIVAAYRRLARTTHPDATGRTDPAAARRFAEISDAYHLLTGDQVTRKASAPGDPTPTARTTDSDEASEQTRPAAAHRRARQDRPPIVAGPVTITPPGPWRRR